MVFTICGKNYDAKQVLAVLSEQELNDVIASFNDIAEEESDTMAVSMPVGNRWVTVSQY